MREVVFDEQQDEALPARHKILDAAGFADTKFMDGGILGWPYPLRRS